MSQAGAIEDIEQPQGKAATRNVSKSGAAARGYATALFRLAEREGQADSIGQELGELVTLMGAQPRAMAVMANPAISAQRKAQTVDKALKGSVSPLFHKFMVSLAHHDAVGHLEQVSAAYKRLLRAKHGEVDIDVYSAHALSDQRLQEVAQSVGRALGVKARAKLRVDKSLIGGLKLRIGDKLIDGSVASRLARVGRRLAEEGSQAIRQKLDSIVTD